MGYKIIYQSNNQSRKCRIASRKEKTALICILVAVIFLVAGLYGERIYSWVIPGNMQITEQALEKLAESLKSGESVQIAVVAFCQDIIDHANLQ